MKKIRNYTLHLPCHAHPDLLPQATITINEEEHIRWRAVNVIVTYHWKCTLCRKEYSYTRRDKCLKGDTKEDRTTKMFSKLVSELHNVSVCPTHNLRDPSVHERQIHELMVWLEAELNRNRWEGER